MDPLVAYIQKELQKGFSEELIQKKLHLAGYTSEEITNAFHDFETKQHYNTFVNVENEHKKKEILHILFALFCIVIIAGILILVIPKIEWNKLPTLVETKKSSPTTEQDCDGLEYRENEQCLMILAATYKNTTYCTNITSKVMKYECRTSVWEKNYCNYLILTNQNMGTC
ncbi:MAG: hypothetical protein WC254_04015 [Candidatus Woesearchaeota archaeon]|jgi:hypothetical protein